jgi:hypothetical protein
MFVTFMTWENTLGGTVPREDLRSKPVTVNPHEVVHVEDYCGDQLPGSIITLKSKKTYLVKGIHADIVAALEAGRKDEKMAEKLPDRRAVFHRSQKQLHLWLTPNMHGWRDCKDFREAQKIVADTQVPQRIEVE